MTTFKTFIKKYSVLTYFILTFVITWGCMVLMLGPGNFPLSAELFEEMGALVYVGMLIGPGVASILLIALTDGKDGFRDLFSRFGIKEVKAGWIIAALLGTPLLATIVLLVLSQFSPEFMPALFVSDEKMSLVLTAIMTGLMVGLFEELGWTGFAIPRMLTKRGFLSSGIIVGILWGAWHFLPFWENDSFLGALPLTLLAVRLFSWLPPFRVLMVWIYDRTESLLVVILMHASLVFTTLTLPSMELSGMALLTWLLVWAAALWAVVAALSVAGKLKTEGQV